MAKDQELAVQEKKEMAGREEKTISARTYMPNADIYESDEALTVVMEVPGVNKDNVDIDLEDDVLSVRAAIDFSKYEGLEPVHVEYNVGHFARSFTISDKIDREGISADLNDGVLTLTLKKAKAAMPRKILIS